MEGGGGQGGGEEVERNLIPEGKTFSCSKIRKRKKKKNIIQNISEIQVFDQAPHASLRSSIPPHNFGISTVPFVTRSIFFTLTHCDARAKSLTYFCNTVTLPVSL